MYCTKCGTLNDNDSLFCKKCGNSLINDYIENSKSEKEGNKNVINKKKIINKKIVKKVDKVKNKTKNKENNKKMKDKNKKDVIIVKKMSGFQKFTFIFLITIIIALIAVIGIFGPFAFSEYTKEVPSVVGMNYSKAKLKLEKLKFTVSKKEIEGEEGIVLKQSKKLGTRLISGTNIVLYVGHVEEKLPNLIGLSKEAVTSIIEKYNIKYEIEIVNGDKEGVISQNYKKGTKIKDIKILKLKIGILEEKEERNINQEEIKEEENENND